MVDAAVDTNATEDTPANDASGAAQARTRRGRGHPRGSFDPSIDWQSIEKDYIYGWEVPSTSHDGLAPPTRHYPSMRELGTKYGCSHALIGRKSKSLNWAKRRKVFQNALTEETDRAVAKAAALSTADAVALIDKWIGRFESNLREKRVRADNVADLDRIMRLREFLLGNADQRSETTHVLSLDAMQERYRTQREARAQRGELAADAALAGVLADGDVHASPVDAMFALGAATIDAEDDELDPEERGEGTAGSMKKSQSIEEDDQ